LLEINKVSIYLLSNGITRCISKRPSWYNIAKFISKELEKNDHVYKGKDFDLAIISSPQFLQIG